MELKHCACAPTGDEDDYHGAVSWAVSASALAERHYSWPLSVVRRHGETFVPVLLKRDGDFYSLVYTLADDEAARAYR